MNTDGSFTVGQDKASFGELFRDDQGRWLIGYNGQVENMKILWSIHKGLLLAKDNN